MKKGQKMSDETKAKLSAIRKLQGNFRTGTHFSEEHKANLSKSLKKRNSEFGRKGGVKKGTKFSDVARKNMKEAQLLAYKLRTRKAPWEGKKRPDIARENNYNWKGNPKSENHRIRESTEYKLVREACFKRDNYTCIWCGQRGGKLNADHIKPFALFPELRFALDNLRTLCLACHRRTETYGGKLSVFNRLSGKK